MKRIEGKHGRIYKYDGTSTIWDNKFIHCDETDPQESDNGGTSTGPKATPDGGDGLVSGFEAVDIQPVKLKKTGAA